MDLDHPGDHFPGNKGKVDPVSPLALPVADVGAEVAGAEPAPVPHALPGRLDEPIQPRRTRMAVAEGAFNQHLRFP